MNKVENFAKNLESIRKTRKKSLTEFAREIGIPKFYIAVHFKRWEHNA